MVNANSMYDCLISNDDMYCSTLCFGAFPSCDVSFGPNAGMSEVPCCLFHLGS